jgi:hypothetical protein
MSALFLLTAEFFSVVRSQRVQGRTLTCLVTKFPRSRVLLVRADDQTPAWKEEIGRQFRLGYYGPSDGLEPRQVGKRTR